MNKRLMRGAIERSALILAAFQRHKRLTQTTLAEAIGVTQITRMIPWLEWWLDQGVVYVCGWAAKSSPIYALQPGEPFGEPDAPYFARGLTPACTPLLGEKTRRFMYDGRRMTVSQIAHTLGIKPSTLRSRLKSMPLEDAVKMPVRKQAVRQPRRSS